MTRRLPPRRLPSRPPGPVWEADLAPIAVSIETDPSARHALLIIVSDGKILAGDLVSRPPAQPAQIAESIASAIILAIAAEGSAPRIVRVRHEKVAERLAERLAALEITVETSGVLPQVGDAMASFDQHVVGIPPNAPLSARPSMPRTWAGWELDPGQIRRFFTAAAAYYRAAPWANITNEDIARIKIRGGGSWSASVMGMAGELFGLAMYARHEDLLAVLDGRRDLSGPVLSFSFSRRNEIPREMHAEVRLARWEVAGPTSYPTVLTINTPGGGLPARDMEDLIAAIDAIPRFARDHEAMLAGIDPQRYPIRWKDPGGVVSIVFDGAEERLG